jgi:hypothetical protein
VITYFFPVEPACRCAAEPLGKKGGRKRSSEFVSILPQLGVRRKVPQSTRYSQAHETKHNIVRMTRFVRRPDRTDRFWVVKPTRVRKARLMPQIPVMAALGDKRMCGDDGY